MYSRIDAQQYDSDDSDCTSQSSTSSLPSTSSNSEEFELFNRLIVPSKRANNHHSKDKGNIIRSKRILYYKIFFIMTLPIFAILLLVFFTSADILQVTLGYEHYRNNGSKDNSSTLSVQTYQINLDPKDNFHLFWTPDYEDESVLFELRIKVKTSFDWFAFGFSERGDIQNADFCVLWFDRKKRMHFEDIKTDNESIVTVSQTSEDCRFIKANRKGKILRFAFRRSWDTCHSDDYIIDSGTTHLVYASGSGPMSRLDGLHLDSYNHGFQRVQLLKTVDVNAEPLSKETKIFEATNSNLTVPSIETTYWCKLLKFPETFRKKIHIVQYEAIITPGNENLAHHMELFHCEVNSSIELKDYDGFCSQIPDELKPCKRVTAAWAYGAGPMVYPKHVGLPVGGENYSLYIMLEMHYNNPSHIQDQVDSSGIRLFYTETLRPIDAGIIEIGLEYTDKNSIPPQTEMTLHGYCVSECTRAGLPPYGINIFASQLHTHLTGIRSYTTHVRGGIELPEVNRDNHYSPHYQEIRRLPRRITVFPGDALIHTCVYRTMDRVNMTLGGFGIRDEMCVNYMHYFPKTDLEVCKSSIDTEALNLYFDNLRRFEFQNTSRNYPISDNYYNIQWNPRRIEDLDALYRDSPLSMQCNQSSGQRFPGYWNGVETTKILRPLEHTSRKCKLTMAKDVQEFDSFNEKFDTSSDVDFNTFNRRLNERTAINDHAAPIDNEPEIDLELSSSDIHTSDSIYSS